MNERPELSGKQAEAAAILGSGGTVAEAAAAANVTPRTITRWRGDPAFAAEVRQLTATGLDTATRVLAAGAAAAARYLCEVAEGKSRADPNRVNAARLVLTIGPELAASTDREARLAALEQALGLADPVAA